VLDVPPPALGDECADRGPQLQAVSDRGSNSARDALDGLLDDGEDTLSLVLDGAVDVRLETELAEILASVRSSGVRHIVLEMATVTSIDAAGLRFLFAVRCLADERGGTVRLADATDAVLDVVAAAGAEEMLGLVGGAEEQRA
jgi:anti-anti-sigma factor